MKIWFIGIVLFYAWSFIFYFLFLGWIRMNTTMEYNQNNNNSMYIFNWRICQASKSVCVFSRYIHDLSTPIQMSFFLYCLFSKLEKWEFLLIIVINILFYLLQLNSGSSHPFKKVTFYLLFLLVHVIVSWRYLLQNNS